MSDFAIAAALLLVLVYVGVELTHRRPTTFERIFTESPQAKKLRARREALTYAESLARVDENRQRNRKEWL